MVDEIQNLLLEIVRCRLVKDHFLVGGSNNPCAEILSCQRVTELADLQVPEPWNGDLRSAPLLFLSSNPSINELEEYPRWDTPDEEIMDFFEHRFGYGRKAWVSEGKRGLHRDGSYGRATPYWCEVKKRADEIFERETTAGIDYALSEVVHCKSRDMIGVKGAAETCTQRYLQRVLDAAGAKVVAVVGEQTRRVVEQRLGIQMGEKRLLELNGKVYLFLPAPGSNQPRKLERILSQEEMDFLRDRIRKHGE